MVFLTTEDGVRIAARFYGVTAPAYYLVLVHMMPSGKESWHGFAEFMQGEGCASLAIDLRGHGDSEGGPGGYRAFTDRGHQKSIQDIHAAVRFLEEQGALPEKIMFVGASIGANLSLKYIVQHPEYKAAVLFSAGLNYRGIRAEPLVKKLHRDQRVMLIASRADERGGGNNAAANEFLAHEIPKSVERELIILDTEGHGTELLLKESEERLLPKIVSFLKL